MAARAPAVNSSLHSQIAADKGQYEAGMKQMQALKAQMEALQKQGPQARPQMVALQQRGQQLQQALGQLRQRLGRGMHLLQLGLGDALGLVHDCTSTPAMSENVVRGGTPTYVYKSYSFTVCPFEYVIQRWEHREDWEFKTCLAENGEKNLTSPTQESNIPYCEEKAKKALAPQGAGQQIAYCRGLADAKRAQACLSHMSRAIAAQQEQELRTFLGLYNQTASVPNKYWVFEDAQGTPCSNGKRRSVRIHLVCGATGSPRASPLLAEEAVAVGQGDEAGTLHVNHSTGRLLRVAENGMCNYEMTLETPAVCSTQLPKPTASQGGGGVFGWLAGLFGTGAKDEV